MKLMSGYWPIADIEFASPNVCFRGQSGHRSDIRKCPLMTQSGHLACYHSISVMTMMPGAALGSKAYKQCRALLEDKMSIENDVPADRTSPTRAAEISRSGLRPTWPQVDLR